MADSTPPPRSVKSPTDRPHRLDERRPPLQLHPRSDSSPGGDPPHDEPHAKPNGEPHGERPDDSIYESKERFQRVSETAQHFASFLAPAEGVDTAEQIADAATDAVLRRWTNVGGETFEAENALGYIQRSVTNFAHNFRYSIKKGMRRDRRWFKKYKARTRHSRRPDFELEEKEEQENIRNAIGRLQDEEQRRYIVAWTYEDMSYVDIAETYGVTADRVRAQIKLTLRILKGMVDDYKPDHQRANEEYHARSAREAAEAKVVREAREASEARREHQARKEGT